MGDVEILVRPLRDGDVEAMARNDLRAFGVPKHEPWLIDRLRTAHELDRFVVAEHAGRIVGNAAAFSFQLTLPGGDAVPVAGVTWVAVSATHRRRGVMRSMLDQVHAGAVERGEAAAVLWAAEASIYGNVGYGPSHTQRVVTMTLSKVEFRPDAPAGGSVRYLDPGEATEILPRVWETARRLRAGGLARSGAWWRWMLRNYENQIEGEPTNYVVAHFDDAGDPDGYAVYTSDEADIEVEGGHVITVEAFAAANPVAHAELWRLLASLDLTQRIETDQVPFDDPLPWLLTDGRVVRTKEALDGMWLKVIDVKGLFGARAFATDDAVVVDAEALGRWRIAADGCVASHSAADLSMSPVELGAISLGGQRLGPLVAANRIREHTPRAAARLEAMLAPDPLPYCVTHF